jgi:hypothetical protein
MNIIVSALTERLAMSIFFKEVGTPETLILRTIIAPNLNKNAFV